MSAMLIFNMISSPNIIKVDRTITLKKISFEGNKRTCGEEREHLLALMMQSLILALQAQCILSDLEICEMVADQNKTKKREFLIMII